MVRHPRHRVRVGVERYGYDGVPEKLLAELAVEAFA
jgi:hypothetical protein